MQSSNDSKRRIAFIFGGRSAEHEISILSAASVMGELSKERFTPIPIAITKTGEWRLVKQDMSLLSELTDPRITGIFDDAEPITIADFDALSDFAFPLLHGPFGEDGTIQGLFEMLDKPYAGCGVAASAVSMDKILAKEVWSREGIPVCKWEALLGADYEKDAAAEISRIEQALGYPLFVKPANMGSSVGVSKVSSRAEFEAAVAEAFRYDRRIICEEAVVGRELEIALLGNGEPQMGAIGEILQDGEFYDYDEKYKGAGARLSIPAELPTEIAKEITEIAGRAYKVLDGAGFSRIDLFFCEEKSKIYFSEMNAIPGFTKYSMFPLLWRAKGLNYGELIERIIELGYERHNAAYRRK